MRVSALSAAIAAVMPAAVLMPVIAFAQGSNAPNGVVSSAPPTETGPFSSAVAAWA